MGGTGEQGNEGIAWGTTGGVLIGHLLFLTVVCTHHHRTDVGLVSLLAVLFLIVLFFFCLLLRFCCCYLASCPVHPLYISLVAFFSPSISGMVFRFRASYLPPPPPLILIYFLFSRYPSCSIQRSVYISIIGDLL